MLSRRDFVGKLAVGAAVAGTVTAVGSRAQARGTAAATATGSAEPALTSAALAAPELAPAPWQLVAPLRAGSDLGHGWAVADLSPVHAGSCVLTAVHESGRQQRVHLCRNTGAPVGLVHTDAVDLVVMNGGAGDVATDEGLAQAVAAVAHAVARNEDATAVATMGLLAHADRVERFGASAQLR